MTRGHDAEAAGVEVELARFDPTRERVSREDDVERTALQAVGGVDDDRASVVACE